MKTDIKHVGSHKNKAEWWKTKKNKKEKKLLMKKEEEEKKDHTLEMKLDQVY